MDKYRRLVIYLLNCFLLFLIVLSTASTFLDSLQVYSVVFYIGFIHLSICIYLLYQDVFKINYSVLSRYYSIEAYILSRYMIILKNCLKITIGTVGLPITLFAMYFQTGIHIEIMVPIFIRYVILSIFVCVLSFTLLCLIPILQRKSQYIVLTSLGILPFISTIKEGLNRESIFNYYLDLGVNFEWHTKNIIELILVRNLPAVVYSIIISLTLLIFFSNRIEFVVYEKNN